MLIKTLVVGQIETNCYVVTDEATLDCVVIDPGDESNTIMNYLEENKLKCRAVFLTHAHFDHVSAANAVLEETGAPLYICEKELPVVKSGASGRFRLPEDVRYYKDGDEIEISGLKFKVLETPGHTPGGVSLVCGDALFSGDTLFRGSCGRTDFPGGDYRAMLRSLGRLGKLEGNYQVYPGHEQPTNLDFERRFNPYMQQGMAQ